MRLIAFITEREPIKQILSHIGEPTEPPKISEARGPPDYDEVDQRLEYELTESETAVLDTFDQSNYGKEKIILCDLIKLAVQIDSY